MSWLRKNILFVIHLNKICIEPTQIAFKNQICLPSRKFAYEETCIWSNCTESPWAISILWSLSSRSLMDVLHSASDPSYLPMFSAVRNPIPDLPLNSLKITPVSSRPWVLIMIAHPLSRVHRFNIILLVRNRLTDSVTQYPIDRTIIMPRYSLSLLMGSLHDSNAVVNSFITLLSVPSGPITDPRVSYPHLLCL